MKGVLKHMQECTDPRNCTYAHCGSSRQIISHYSKCTKPDCPICEKLRTKTPNNAGAAGGMGHVNTMGNTMTMGRVYAPHRVQNPQAGPPQISEEKRRKNAIWRQSFKADQRGKLKLKLVDALRECVQDHQNQEARINELATKIEDLVYKTATDDQEYYKLLAERIYKLKKARLQRNELDKKRRLSNSGMKMPPYGQANGMGGGGSVKKLRVGIREFKKEELKHHFMPLITALFRQPESAAFHFPVDPVMLQIPDYFEIIKKPMDLSTIQTRLEEGYYSDPWDVCDDVRLMWKNAWLYNRKASRIYKYTTKLSEIFDNKVDPVMTRLGFCCGKLIHFTPVVMHCHSGKPQCIIPRDQKYWCFEHEVTAPQNYCLKCFEDAPGMQITLGIEEQNKVVEKSQFATKVNDANTEEPMCRCTVCGRKHHDICQLWHKDLAKKFVCKSCRQGSDTKAKKQKHVSINPWTAQKLPKTKLGEFMEKRVRKMLKDEKATAEEQQVTVRVVSIRNKEVPVSENLLQHYKDDENGAFPAKFGYKSKALFVYQKYNGEDLCFFGLHVQEFGSDCPEPNRGRVYVSYLDSVYYYRPKNLRTLVYKELLMAYFDYCKSIGYRYAHIWACPPCQGDDYIFHCHPQDQKVPKPKRLQEWYKDMLNKAKERGCVSSWVDMCQWVRDEDIAYARQIPYFEGDYWPGEMENAFKEIKSEEAEEAAGGGGKKGSKKGSKSKSKGSKKGKGKSGGKKGKQSLVKGKEDLCDKLLVTLEKLKDTFFIVNLVPKSAPMMPIKDEDPDMVCELMDGRDGFLSLCRTGNHEFSSLRRARHSSLIMLFQLHSAESEFNYTCNDCESTIAAMDYRWHCNHKDCGGGDYDLCEKCYKEKNHKHPMERLGFGVGTEASDSGKSQAEQKRLSIKRCIDSLVHACQCRNDKSCKDPSCNKMKQVVKHTRDCPSRHDPKKPCHICKQLVALCCYHAKHCSTADCPVPFCKSIKTRLQRQQALANRRIQQQNQRRFMIQQQHTASQHNPGQAVAVGMVPGPNGGGYGGAMGAAPAQARGLVQQMPMNAHQHPHTQQAQARPPASYPTTPSSRLDIINNNIQRCRNYLLAIQKRQTDILSGNAPQPTPEEKAREKKSVDEVNGKLLQLINLKTKLESGQQQPPHPQQRPPQITPEQKAMLQQMINHLRSITRPEQECTIAAYNPQEKQLFQWYKKQRQLHEQRQQQQTGQQAPGMQQSMGQPQMQAQQQMMQQQRAQQQLASQQAMQHMRGARASLSLFLGDSEQNSSWCLVPGLLAHQRSAPRPLSLLVAHTRRSASTRSSSSLANTACAASVRYGASSSSCPKRARQPVNCSPLTRRTPAACSKAMRC